MLVWPSSRIGMNWISRSKAFSQMPASRLIERKVVVIFSQSWERQGHAFCVRLFTSSGKRDVEDLDGWLKDLQGQPSPTVGEVFVFIDECHRTQSGQIAQDDESNNAECCLHRFYRYTAAEEG